MLTSHTLADIDLENRKDLRWMMIQQNAAQVDAAAAILVGPMLLKR
jgi:hypothetical protein